jgi:signal peptidase complex subunit 3
MHSIFSRINNLSALLSSCLMALVALITISSFTFTAKPEGSQVSVKYPRIQDLTLLFNWNTEQVFVCLGAEYKNAQG